MSSPANVYRQDFPVVGLTSQVSVTYNRNREGDEIEVDTNGFPVRPALLGDLRGRDYDITYLGYSADGHIGRINLTASAYAAFGKDGTASSRPSRAGARSIPGHRAVDRSRLDPPGAHQDFMPPATRTRMTIRKRGSTRSSKIRSSLARTPVTGSASRSRFAGGGRVIGINGRNGILNSLRSSKDQGQSNFNNPGTILAGLGFDADVTPKIRLSAISITCGSRIPRRCKRCGPKAASPNRSAMTPASRRSSVPWRSRTCIPAVGRGVATVARVQGFVHIQPP